MAALRRGAPRRASYPNPDGEPTDVFLDVFPVPPTLLIFGGVHIGVPLARFAKQLGFRVRVIDARGRFANEERFPDADEIILTFADEYLASTRVDSSTFVAVLSHDPKLDDPALVHDRQAVRQWLTDLDRECLSRGIDRVELTES